MDEILQRSYELRNDPDVHYNCAQGVFIPFAEKKGISLQEAAALTQHFGAGMRMGLTCGSITGGLMALGLYGTVETKDAVELIRQISAEHEGRTQCRDLLRAEVKHPEDKKPHCDKMVYDAVKAVEDILRSHDISFE